jgi:hypothetical protein
MGLRASAIRSCAHRRSSPVKIAGGTRSSRFYSHTHTHIYIYARVRVRVRAFCISVGKSGIIEVETDGYETMGYLA